MIRGLVRDFGYGFRAMRRNPGFTSTIVVTLALGIGANTSVFSLLSALVLRPIPGISAPKSLIELTGDDLSYQDVVELRSQVTALSGLAPRKPWNMDLRIGNETRRVRGALVGSNYFRVLGSLPAQGRSFLPEEESGPPGAHPVAVIGYGLWHDWLGADPHSVGWTVRINGHMFTVIGIAPEGFHGVALFENEEIWVPLDMYHEVAPGLIAGISGRGQRWLSAIGRLKPGIDIRTARAQVDTVARRMERTYPDDWEQRINAMQFRAEENSRLTGYLAFLYAIVAAVLLITCANVAGLLLARGSARSREIAIRAAVGAKRMSLVVQLLVESLTLAMVGAVAGLLLTVWTTHVLRIWLVEVGEDFPTWLSLAPDARVLGLAALLAAVSACLFGTAPALQLSGVDPVMALKVGKTAGSIAAARFRRFLVVFQVALSAVLLVGAGLLGGALRRQWASTPATAPEQVLQVRLEPAAEGYLPASANALYARLMERVQALPGVTAVALSRNRVPWDDSFFDETIMLDGNDSSESLRDVKYDVVTAGYFRMMERALQRGRDFTVQDREGATRVAIVNAALARRLWPGANPLGRRFRLHGDREVIAVADDRTPYGGVPRPFVYLPLTQDNPWPDSPMNLNVRTNHPAALLASVRQEIAELEPNLPLLYAGTLAESIRKSDADVHLAVMVLGTAGLLALTLSAVGLYGLLGYSVARRVPELAIRRSLGASNADVLWLVMREGLAVISLGLAAGLAIAAAVMPRVLRALFFGFESVAVDPLALVGVILVLVPVGLAACLVPARQALRVDPAVALRTE